MDYKAVLFDLDDTVFDRKSAMIEFAEYLYSQLNVSCEKTLFVDELIRLDNNGYSEKTFVIGKINELFGLSINLKWYVDTLIECMGISASKQKSVCNLFVKIQKRNVKIGIITNGTSRLQRSKTRNMNIENYVDVIVISEEVGFKKPDKRIYEYALKELNVEPEECIMVGDNIEIDVVASKKCGIVGILIDKDNSYRNENIEIITDLQDVLNYLL